MSVLYFPVSSSISGRTADYNAVSGHGTLDGYPIYGYTVYYKYTTTSNVRKLYQGSSKINNLHIGTTAVKQVYVGNTKVFGTNTTTNNVYCPRIYPCYVYYVQGTFYTSAQLNKPYECATQLEVSSDYIQYGVQINHDEDFRFADSTISIDLYIKGTITRKDYDVGGHQSSSGTQYIYNDKVIAILNTNDSGYLTSITDSYFHGTFPSKIKIPAKTMMFFNMGDFQIGSSTASSSAGDPSSYDCKIVITTVDGLVLTMPLDFGGLTNYYAT